MNKATQIPFFSLLLLAGYASFGAILPTPALSIITQYFHIAASKTEAVIYVYLIGYAIGQLIYGPLSNRFSRKKPLIVGLVISFFGCLIGIIAPFFQVFELYILSRFIIAIGTAASLVIGMILIKDCYDEINARRVFSKVILAFAFVPFIASALGGALTHYFGWKILNIALLIYVSILFFAIRSAPETLIPEKRISLSLNYFVNSYKELFKNFEYIRLILLFSLGGAASYVFNAIAPIVTVNTMGISAELYGYLSIIPSIGILLGGFVSTRFAHKISAASLIKLGISLIIIGSLSLGILFKLNQVNLIVLYTISIIIFIGHAVIIPNAGMQAQSTITDHANGTSIMNASALIVSSLLVSVAGMVIEISPIFALPIMLFLIGLTGMLLNFKTYRIF